MSHAIKLKNIQPAQVLALAAQVEVQPGQVVSKTLAQNDAVSLTLFAFAAGEEISTHKSEGDALVTALAGAGRVTISGTAFVLHAGDSIVMPAGQPHAVYATEDFKMSLTVIF